MYELYSAVFYAQPVGRMALFSTLCCHAPLGRKFYTIHTLNRHLKPKYVKSKNSHNLAIINLKVFFRSK